MKQGDLITPTGRLVLPSGDLGGEQWLEFRRLRADVPGGFCIGSSDVPSILDLDGVDTPAHVFRNKVYDIRAEVNEAMIWGHLNEPAIAAEWCRRNRAVIDEIGLVSHVDQPWHQSTIDRRVRECPVFKGQPGHENEECLLEVKNVDSHVSMRWHADIPDRILAQIIHQLFVTGYAHAHYACLIGGNRMKQGIVYADREAKLTRLVVDSVNAFRRDHLLTGIEPAWSDAKPDKMIELDNATHPERDGVAEIGIDGIGEVQEYAVAAAEESAAGKRKKQLAAKLRQLADGRAVVKFADQLAYGYRPGTNTNVDLDKLKEKYPDAYADPEIVKSKPMHTLYIDKAYKVRGTK